MPWLVTDAALEVLQRRVMVATQERMLREMAEALAVFTAERLLVLVLEDLHWSDPSSLNLIAWLAQRQEPAHLLVVGTYRPADALRPGHPLHAVVHELKIHKRGDELSLSWLTESAIDEYLTARFPATTLPSGLARLVHRRTEGNPLFMVAVVDAWEAGGWLEEGEGQRRLRVGLEALAQGVPESLRQLLSQQLARLSVEEQRILEAANVAGVKFSAAAVATGIELDVIEAETRCEALARRQQWLRTLGSETCPDGTTAGRYAFIHALYQDVVYQSVAAARHIYLHRRIGAAKEGAYGARAGEVAAELAVHFEHGRDLDRAVQYLQQAAETASSRHAHREAIGYLRRALSLLNATADTPQLIRQELAVQLALGPALMVTRGLPPRRWRRPMAGRAGCVSTWESGSCFFQPSSGCGGLLTSGRSYRRRVRSGSSSSSWPPLRRTRHCSWKPTGRWGKRSVSRESLPWPGGICSRSSPSMRPGTTRPWPSASGMTLASMPGPWKAGCCGCWGTLSRLCASAKTR